MRHAGVAATLGTGALALLGGCAGSPRMAAIATASNPDWRAVATPEDRGRLSRARAAWDDALGAARRTDAAAIAADPALFAPDASLDRPLPPPGDYRCRTVKLGSQTAAGGLDYVAYPFFACRVAVEGNRTSLIKLTGSQRPVGLIFPYETTRGVFLGTLQLGDETATFDYGRDRMRDLAGWVKRIGAARWRVAFPYPHYESRLDVLELVPAG